MPDDYQFSRVLLLAVDAWRYGPRDGRQQYELQRDLSAALSAAATRSGLDRMDWQTQNAGDGLLVVVPDGGAEPVLVDAFIRELDTWLSRHNHDRVADARLRVRVAVHHGPLIPAQLGYAGDGAVDVCRVRDSRPVRAALDAEPEANLVLAVSERIFEDVIRQRHTSLSAKDFTKVEIADAAKDYRSTAWLRVPGASASRPAARVDDPPTPPAPDLLAVALRFLEPSRTWSDLVDEVLVPSFASARVALPADALSAEEDPMICLSGVSVQAVLGVWVDHLDSLLKSAAPETRIVIGVCPAPDLESASRTARELASSDTAARVLAAARGGRLVVVVPGHVHQEIKDIPGRLVFPETYGPADGPAMLRVPGHSMPPRPVDRVRRRSDGEPATGAGSVNAYGDHGVAIGSGATFHDFHVGDRYGGGTGE